MTDAAETICVDIGNSGLRCVRLASEIRSRSNSPKPSDALPWNGDVLRISWPIRNGQVDHGTGDSAQAQAYLLQSLTAWLRGDSTYSSNGVPPRRWIVSSVQRTVAAHLQACVQRLGASQFHLVTHTDLNLQVDVDRPEQVGVDRLLAAKAALQHVSVEHMIVIQAGSAITVDWVESPNRFRGGAIMPGVPMMLRLLSRGADLLPAVAAGELFDLPPLPGTSTIAAMTAGVSSAVVGGAQHLIARYRELFGADTPVVLSGGDGPRLGPHLGPGVIVVDHLVLRGLAQLATQPNSEILR